jgi:hypothetical protein
MAHGGSERELAGSGARVLGFARGETEEYKGTMAHMMKGSTRARGVGEVVLQPQ